MTPEEKIRRLESQRLEVMADLHRDMAECQAQSIEFANSDQHAKVVNACFEAHRAMVDISQQNMAIIDKRIAQIAKASGKKNPFDQFDGPKKLTAEEYLDRKPGPYDDILNGSAPDIPSRLAPFNGKIDAEK